MRVKWLYLLLFFVILMIPHVARGQVSSHTAFRFKTLPVFSVCSAGDVAFVGGVFKGCTATNTPITFGSGTVTSVSGTANQIASTGGATPVLSLVAGIIPYDVAMSYSGVPDASSVIRVVVPRAFSSGTSWAGSLCSASVAATAQADFILAVNGTTKLTLRFAAAGTTCSLVSPTSVAFAAGDVITVTSPGTPDATLSDVAISLKGSIVLP